MGERKTALVLGGTGVMGSYRVKELIDMGFSVDAACAHQKLSEIENLHYYCGSFTDYHVIKEFLRGRHYDVLIDFMTDNSAKFAERFDLLLSSSAQYFFLSSYRVYSDAEIPTKESSPKLLDITNDKVFLESDDYSLFKAREENILRNSNFKNWTIVRPAITYSSRRMAFVTLELPLMLRRAIAGKPIYIPENVWDVQATCTWAGDVAKMLARLVLNPAALCEDFSVCTSEHHSWGEIAGFYKEILGADIQTVSMRDYIAFFEGNYSKGMLDYDRCVNRVMDNSKILKITGMKQEELLPLKDGMMKAMSEAEKNTRWPDYTLLYGVDRAMDLYHHSIFKK